MSSCVNPNNKEFQEILKRINNPLLAELEYDRQENVKYLLKSVDALFSEKAKQLFIILSKNRVQGETFWKKLQSDLSIPKEQIEILKSFNTYDREELLTNLLANYSYTVEIKIAKEKSKDYMMVDRGDGTFEPEPINPEVEYEEVLDEEGNIINMRPVLTERGKQQIADMESKKPTQYYSDLTVQGGTNYTENRIITPQITPIIKGHPQFAQDNDIGWFRSDDKYPFTGFLENLIASGTIKKVPCG